MQIRIESTASLRNASGETNTQMVEMVAIALMVPRNCTKTARSLISLRLWMRQGRKNYACIAYSHRMIADRVLRDSKFKRMY